jgi:hypothetical protein
MLNSIAALQRRGLTTYSNASLTTEQTVVSSGTNTNGIIVRTVAGNTSGGQLLVVRAGGNTILLLDAPKFYSGPGLVIPPGQSLTVASSGAAIDMVLTYDLL